MISRLRELWKHREILYVITWREIHIKYKQSIMGFLWAILMPMLIIGAGLLVRVGVARLSGLPMTLEQLATVSVKSIPWAFFISSLRFATSSLVANVNLVTKINFPNEVFPISAVLSQLFDLMVASIPLAAVLIFSKTGISPHALWAPVLLLLLVLQVMGLGILLSAANLFFRDVKYLVEVGVTFAIFFTPVFYDADMFGRWSTLVLLNPVAPILEGLNAALVLHRTPDPAWVGYSAAAAAALFSSAFTLFGKIQPKFAENI